MKMTTILKELISSGGKPFFLGNTLIRGIKIDLEDGIRMFPEDAIQEPSRLNVSTDLTGTVPGGRIKLEASSVFDIVSPTWVATGDISFKDGITTGDSIEISKQTAGTSRIVLSCVINGKTEEYKLSLFWRIPIASEIPVDKPYILPSVGSLVNVTGFSGKHYFASAQISLAEESDPLFTNQIWSKIYTTEGPYTLESTLSTGNKFVRIRYSDLNGEVSEWSKPVLIDVSFYPLDKIAVYKLAGDFQEEDLGISAVSSGAFVTDPIRGIVYSALGSEASKIAIVDDAMQGADPFTLSFWMKAEANVAVEQELLSNIENIIWETPHPYTNGASTTELISVDESPLRLHCYGDTEANLDKVSFFSESGDPHGVYSGANFSVVAEVTGSKVEIRFQSDGSVVSDGVRVSSSVPYKLLLKNTDSTYVESITDIGTTTETTVQKPYITAYEGSWAFVVIRSSGSNISMNIDDISVISNASAIKVGNNGLDLFKKFRGLVSDIRLYPRTITDTEATDLKLATTL